jgi:hypothetical protein
LGGCQSNSLNTAAPPERMPRNGINKSLRSLCSLIADFCNRIDPKRTWRPSATQNSGNPFPVDSGANSKV